MQYKVLKWVALALVITVLFVFVALCFMLCKSKKPTIYNTPFGKVNITTAQVAMIDYYTPKPHISYLIHKNVAQNTDSLLKVTTGDTIWYCLTPETVKYYLVKKNSLGKFQIWEWNKYNNVAWPEVTPRFKQEYILIR